jgi:Domain of unknown function (DUF4082)
MKCSILAATAALALAACTDSGPLLEGRTPSAPLLDIVWGPAETIFTNQVPGETGYAGPSGWQVGTVFTAEDTLLITGFRFYQAVGETGSHTARLHTSGGTLVASKAFGATSTGWNTTTLTSTVQILPGEYVVSVNTNTYQVKSGGYFYFNGPINRTKLVATGGRYGQPINVFPSSGSTSAFFVDVTFRPKLCNDDVDYPCP